MEGERVEGRDGKILYGGEEGHASKIQGDVCMYVYSEQLQGLERASGWVTEFKRLQKESVR